MANESSCSPAPGRVERRSFFQWVTFGISAAASAVLGAPVIGYFLGTRQRSTHWVVLDEVARFPVNETRLQTFDNPLRQPWDGMTALTGVYVRNLGIDTDEKSQFLVFAVNCTHLGCPVSWFPQSGLFMCPCHGVFTTRTVSMRRDRLREACSTVRGAFAMGVWKSRRRITRHCRTHW